MQQPEFFESTPIKGPADEGFFVHNTASGLTPDGASPNVQAAFRMEMRHAGVQGHTVTTPCDVTTPKK